MSTSPVPVIQISLAPPEEPQPEPFSPFTPMNAGFSSPEDAADGYRPALLTPPVQSWSLSPRRPLTAQPKGKGINDDEFQALLRASKERSAAASSRKPDLRKEVALKVHKTKQVERRALFLSKIGAPPSPTAISLPKTPPESPSIFHYSLPSPGLCSPLALFEKLGLDDQDSQECGVRKVWVEQVDFRLPELSKRRAKPEPRPQQQQQQLQQPPTPSITVTTADGPERSRKGHARLPSLEQITERYSQTTVLHPGSPGPAPMPTPAPARQRAPLPAFLNARKQSPPPPAAVEVPIVKISKPEETVTRPRLACTGRIRFPSRSSTPPTTKPLPALPFEPLVPAGPLRCSPRQRTQALPSSPMSPLTPLSPTPPSLQITTTHIPRMSSTSPVKLTEANLHALNSRAATARDMLSAIRRRTVIGSAGARMYAAPPPSSLVMDEKTWPSRPWGLSADDEKQRRRHSAPADLPKVNRAGFMHPVLAQPGGF